MRVFDNHVETACYSRSYQPGFKHGFTDLERHSLFLCYKCFYSMYIHCFFVNHDNFTDVIYLSEEMFLSNTDYFRDTPRELLEMLCHLVL